MTKEHLQTAINEGIPFIIRMANGREYKVADRYRVALGKTNVVVVGDDDMPHVPALLTMTGISYLKAGQWQVNGRLRQIPTTRQAAGHSRKLRAPRPRGARAGREAPLRAGCPGERDGFKLGI